MARGTRVNVGHRTDPELPDILDLPEKVSLWSKVQQAKIQGASNALAKHAENFRQVVVVTVTHEGYASAVELTATGATRGERADIYRALLRALVGDCAETCNDVTAL